MMNKLPQTESEALHAGFGIISMRQDNAWDAGGTPLEKSDWLVSTRKTGDVTMKFGGEMQRVSHMKLIPLDL